MLLRMGQAKAHAVRPRPGFALYQRQRRGQATPEADIDDPLPPFQRHQLELMRARRRRLIIGHAQPDPTHQRPPLKPHRHQRAMKERILLEAITAPAAMDELVENDVGIEADAAPQYYVQILERDGPAMGLHQPRNAIDAHRRRRVQPDPVEISTEGKVACLSRIRHIRSLQLYWPSFPAGHSPIRLPLLRIFMCMVMFDSFGPPMPAACISIVIS